jgi:hypothetical protein
MSYCLPVFGNTYGLDIYKEENWWYFSFTVKENHKLQVLQNKLNRLLLDIDCNTPTEDLLHQTDSLTEPKQRFNE